MWPCLEGAITDLHVWHGFFPSPAWHEIGGQERRTASAPAPITAPFWAPLWAPIWAPVLTGALDRAPRPHEQLLRPPRSVPDNRVKPVDGRSNWRMSLRQPLTFATDRGLMDGPPTLRAAGDEADGDIPQLHPEVVDFARWFADWWRRRARRLVAEQAEERRAA